MNDVYNLHSNITNQNCKDISPDRLKFQLLTTTKLSQTSVSLPHIDFDLMTIKVPSLMTKFNGGKMFLRAKYDTIETIDTLWFCANDLRPKIPDQSFEVFSMQGVKQILHIPKTLLFETATC